MVEFQIYRVKRNRIKLNNSIHQVFFCYYYIILCHILRIREKFPILILNPYPPVGIPRLCPPIRIDQLNRAIRVLSAFMFGRVDLLLSVGQFDDLFLVLRLKDDRSIGIAPLLEYLVVPRIRHSDQTVRKVNLDFSIFKTVFRLAAKNMIK